jgi:hypothetical protein
MIIRKLNLDCLLSVGLILFVNSTCDCVQVSVRKAVAVRYMLCAHMRFLVSITVLVCAPGCGGKETTVPWLLLCHQKHSKQHRIICAVRCCTNLQEKKFVL